jgi:acyl-[acyl-carrier-protein] desaturase
MTVVNNPILDALGLEGKRALERGVQEAKKLPPGLGPEHVALSRSGEFVLSPAAAPSVRSSVEPIV